MADSRVQNLARLLVNYCVEVQPKEKVVIEGSTLGLPLVTETYREVIRAGGNPTVVWREPVFAEILLKESNDDQLNYVSDVTKTIFETFDCRIVLLAEDNTRSLNGIDPARQKIYSTARQELIRTSMMRSASGDLRWVLTQYPTNAYAQDADMSLEEHEDFVYGACQVDSAEPIAAWEKMAAKQQRLVDYLDGKKRIEVKGPHANLTFSIEGRTFLNDDGRRNMPGGEIFTGPVEDSMEGWINFTYPAIYRGREVSGISLRFEAGKVVDASATKNEAFMLSVLDTDEGARYVGEFAIGTNPGIQQFTRSILFDEKIGGTIHMAVGASYPETGAKNESAVHWDMICDMRDGGQIFVDDVLFYDSGHFKIL